MERPRCALAIVTKTAAVELASATVISRDVAAYHGHETVWDEHYRTTVELHPGDPGHEDVRDMMLACSGSAGPGAIPLADWLIYLYLE